ncbi:hypothetical protein ACOME3_002341 [Neoechinorhynchus agilis]
MDWVRKTTFAKAQQMSRRMSLFSRDYSGLYRRYTLKQRISAFFISIFVLAYIFRSRNCGRKQARTRVYSNEFKALLQGVIQKNECDIFLVDLDWLNYLNRNLSDEVTFGYIDRGKSLLATYENLKRRKEWTLNEVQCTNYRDLGGVIAFHSQKRVYILNFKKQGDYLYVCNMNLSSKRWFGDVARTVDIFKLKPVKTIFGIVNVPANTEQFIRDYNTSKFLECNKTLQKKLFDLYPDQRHNVNRVNEKILPGIVAIKKQMKSLGKNFFLAGGTLLGWYRQCGIIEQSKDVDFAIFDSEYNERVPNAFLGGRDMKLALRYGHPSIPGSEIRLTNGKYVFDLFALYKNSSTDDMLHCIYQAGNHRFVRTITPIKQLCSCDLLGIRLLVTCDPLSYIENEYGKYPRWFYPRTNEVWTNLKYEQTFNSTFAECVYLERYDKNGKKVSHQFKDKATGRVIKCKV